jgi:flagellar assembly protein FliH
MAEGAMDATIIPTPAVAKDSRLLAVRRRASPVVVAIEKAPAAVHEVAAEPVPPVDVHLECRAREGELAAQIRRELEADMARELDAAREAACTEGREQGAAEGRDAALAEARAAIAAQGARVEALLAGIAERHEATLMSARDGAVAIGFAAACRILGEKILSGEGVRGVVEQLLAQARAGERVTVRLHGDDLALLRERSAVDELCADRPVDFVEDASLARGDCCVDTAAGTLEAILLEQVESLRAALAGPQGALRGAGPQGALRGAGPR